MPKAKQSTFRSYIDGNGDISDKKLSKSQFYGSEIESQTVQPSLLQGETEVARAHNVVKYSPFHDSKQGGGDVGVFFVTNFRVMFFSGSTGVDSECQRNKLLKEDDIILNCVDAIYQVSKSRKKKLSPGNAVSGHIKNITLQCKDFQVHSFNFKMAQKDEAKKATNALVHHCFPSRLDLLFAFDYKPENNNEGSDVPRFANESDWQQEVDRLRVTGFKVVHCNSNYQNCDSLPEVMVVPESMDIPELKKYANQFVDYRWPVWSYTYKNGVSLVRMADVIPESHEAEMGKRVFEKIRLTHPDYAAPVMMDCSELQQSQQLPSLKEIQHSFDKLRELCTPSKRKALSANDNSWMSSLDSCGWLQVVYKCLKISLQVLDTMVNNKQTVILKEKNSRDLTPVLTCLVQLMLDPHFRTTGGFQALIEREWVALGHDFTNRCGLLIHSEPCPLFILFLDCVWQLQVQFPSAFQFSELYLTTLWDTVCLGLFENFIFDSMRKRANAASGFQQYNNSQALHLLSAWDWSRQFDKENMALFNNPLYVARTELKLPIPTHHRGLSSGEEVQMRRAYSKKLSSIHETIPKQDIQILRPVVSAPLLKFWSHCYLRWVGPLQILGGGNPSRYLQQCVLVEEILCLKHQVNSLESDRQFLRSERPRSELVFSSDISGRNKSTQSSMMRWTTGRALTSSFPFRITNYRERHTSTDTPISLFLENSFIQDSEEDAESVDELSVCEPEALDN